MEFVKFVTVILMKKQVCVLMVTSGTIAATSDGATKDGHHENMMDVSSKWIWSLHAEQLIVLWGFHRQSCLALQFMHKISSSSCHICLQFKNHGI